MLKPLGEVDLRKRCSRRLDVEGSLGPGTSTGRGEAFEGRRLLGLWLGRELGRDKVMAMAM